jgi:CHAT domain-containing protein/tetratricopeptide (TPR) repeat protein
MRRQWLGLAFAWAVLLAAGGHMPAQNAEGKAELDSLYRRGTALRKAGKYAEAARVFEKVVAKADSAFGPEHINTAHLASQLASLYYGLNQYAKAEPLFRRCLQVREARLGKNHPYVAETLGSLGRTYRAMNQYDRAEPLLRRSLRISESRLGTDHLDLAAPLNDLAELCQDVGKHAEAEALYKRSLAITESHRGKDHLDVAFRATNLARFYRTMGRFREARPLYERNLAIRTARQGKDSAYVAVAQMHLAALHFDLWQPVQAELLYKRSLATLEAKMGKEHRLVAVALSGLAGVYMAVGQYDKAEPLVLRSVRITEAAQGKGHPDVATLLHNLGGLYMLMKKPDKAQPLFERALAIKEAGLDKDDPSIGHTLNILAQIHRTRGELDKAEELYRRILRAWETRLGKDHWHLAVIRDGLAWVYEDRGQPEKAQELRRRSLEAMEATFGKDHPDVGRTRDTLAARYAGQGDFREAARLFDRSRRGARKYVASVLPALTEAENASFFATTRFRSSFEDALSLGLARPDNTTIAALSAAWLLNGKALDQEGLASSQLLGREGGADLDQLARRLLDVRQKLARLSVTQPRVGQEKRRLAEIDALTAEEQELGKELRRAGSSAAPPAWVELDEVRRALPADAVLIDVARFRSSDFKARREKRDPGPRYAAWVTPKSGPVRLVDLGPADGIDAAVKRFREGVQAAGGLIRGKGEEAAEKALREHLDALSRLVLKPLLPHVDASKRWLVSPDGNLWLLPWEALTLADGRYAVEKYQVSYLTSGRDLLPAPAPKVKVTAPLVLADPDFDLDPSKARTRAERSAGSGGEDGTRALSGPLQLGRVRRLAHTAAEARAITPSLKDYAGVAPRVRLRGRAREAVFKAARSPRVLVLCTHGFFLPAQEVKRDDNGVRGPGGAAQGKPAGKWEDPMLRCGLLLAGCNNADKATTGDDGILTGLEVVGTDLRGCELVVLSACDTGVGKVQTGEGVAGLRQAFQLAGAQAVVSTLWQVPDKQSARLMTFFFRELAKGKVNKAEALRAAKLKIIEERRLDLNAAHPFFWAAFTLTGRP